MGLVDERNSNRIYAYVLSDGLIRTKADENTKGAVKREYETPTGEKGFKYELIYTSLNGLIKQIGFNEGEYGKSLEIDFADNKESDRITCLSLNVESSFAQDLMKKLPNVNLAEKMKLMPYSLTSSTTGKNLRGITIYQNKIKISNFFYDKDAKKDLHSFPPVDREKAKTYDKDDWKIYFLSVKKFLVDYTEKNIIPKVTELNPIIQTEENVEEEITIEDVADIIPGQLVETAKKTETAQPEKISPAEKFKDQPFHTEGEKMDMVFTISEMAKAKFPEVKTPEEIKERVMKETGIAFIDSMLPRIIEALDKIPNIK